MQEFIKAKEREILQLQVRLFYHHTHVCAHVGLSIVLTAILKTEILHLCLCLSKSKHPFTTQQEEAKNFITLENLDQRIEEALDNPQNYNFAIDKDGRVVKRTVLE